VQLSVRLVRHAVARLPMTDHNTRIFVVGTNGAEARGRGGNRA